MDARILCLVCALAAATGSRSAAQEIQSAAAPTLTMVLERVGEYVRRFERDLASVVAEETYTQEVRRGLVLTARRDLKSDLLLVRPRPEEPYIEFRDVFEVDGRPVRDRNQRLQKLFIEPSKSALEAAGRIMTESARYNLGAVDRNINLPLMALMFLDPGNQPRFKFSRPVGDAATLSKSLPKSANFAITADLWVIDYQEVAKGTMIRTSGGRDLPSHGRFWVEPSSGRVLITELVAEDTGVFGTIDVSYQSQPVLGLLVPVEMREAYRRPGREDRIGGAAVYSNFRQFQVKTDETDARAKDK